MSKQKYLVMDIASCHDCNDCFMACKDEHVGNDWMPYTEEQPRHGHRWIKLLRTERGQCPRIDVSYLAMMCQHCEARVKKTLEAIPGVAAAEVSHEAGTAIVTLDAPVENDTLKSAVEAQDYKVTDIA